MAKIKCNRALRLGKGDFRDIVKHAPQLEFTIKGYFPSDDKRYYTGTSYTVDLLGAGGGFLAVLQLAENYTVEIGVGDGAADYYDAEFYYACADVAEADVLACGYGDGVTDREKLLALILEKGWEGYCADSVSFDIQCEKRAVPSVIPASVTDLAELDYSLTELDLIEVEEGNTAFSARDGILYSADRKTLIFCPRSMKSVTVPEGTEALADEAFNYWAGSVLTLPSTLKSIGQRCFANCNNIEKIILPDSVNDVGCGAFAYMECLRELRLSAAMREIPAELCRACSALESVDIPQGITDMGYHAFSCCHSLTKVTLPKHFKDVGEHAYWNCTALKSVHFEGNAKLFRQSFADCEALEELIIDGALWGMGREALSGCASLKSFVCGGKSTEIADSKIDFRALCGCTSLEDFEAPSGIVHIGQNVFEGCTALKSVTFPKTVSGVEFDIFEGCTALTNVTFKSTYVNIWNHAFEGADALKEVVFEGHTQIGDKAFEGCGALERVTVKGKLFGVGERAFAGCRSLVSFDAAYGEHKNSGESSIDSEAFAGCESLETLTVPCEIGYLGYRVFKGCTSLRELCIGESVKRVASGAFSDCPALEQISFLNTDESVDINMSFNNCPRLKMVVFEGGAKLFIPFMNCPELETLVVKGEISGFTDDIARDCPKLTGITKK